jgi:hypothetical protein
MIQPSLIGILLPRLIALAALLAAGSGAFAQAPASAVQGYISVEAFELRKEFVLRFDTISARIDAAGVTAIDAGNRAALEESIGGWLAGQCPVEVDGRPLAMDLDRVHFVRPDLEKGLVVEDRDSVPAAEALVGVVFAAALDGPPGVVRVVWEVFPADGSEAVVEAGVRGRQTARRLTPQNAELIWKNDADLAVPTMLALPPVPPARGWMTWQMAAAAVVGLLGILKAGILIRRDRLPRAAIEAAIALVVAAAIGWAGSRSEAPVAVDAEQADEISYALLRNVYHAFDYRRESDIYDTLAKSATGDLLTRIYLEIQRSLQVETQGGARVRVTDVDLRKCALVPPAAGAFVADCEWVAVGTVTHWGHTHDRVNRYRARLSIAPVDGQWRLVGLELMSEERINTGRS